MKKRQTARDPEWYAEQATKLRDEFEQKQNQLREYQLLLTMPEV
jgi:hypothetical protein